MNVLIPMGGLGSRFSKDGYKFPKPLIKIVGRQMILWILDFLTLLPEDTLWIAIDAEIEKSFEVCRLITFNFPSVNLKCVPLKFQTRGAAETLYCITSQMSPEELDRKTISIDCDTIYFSDVLGMYRDTPCGASFYFEDTGTKPLFSYIQFADEETKKIVNILEKQRISTHANTGAYAFQSGRLLRKYLEAALDNAVPKAGEFYTSNIISEMIANGEDFVGVHVEDFAIVGTPNQMNAFLRDIKAGLRAPKNKLRICFDLDMTLVTSPTVPGDYSTVLPIQENIQILRDLYDAGNTIIIYTARRMRTHKGNIGAILADVGPVTFETLKNLEIPFHEIYFGKPYAHLYIDDLAVNGLVDTAREIGWASSLTEEVLPPREALPSRNFNSVMFLDEIVTKSSLRKDFEGEIFFYRNIPSELQLYFPKFVAVTEVQDGSTLSLERIRGVVFSRLLIQRCLSPGRFTKLLKSLISIHSFPLPSSSGQPPNIYANYNSKILSREKEYETEYGCLRKSNPLLDEALQLFQPILRGYELEQRGKFSQIIHGDPVLSNIILTSKAEVKMIDMRGMLGDQLTLAGDQLYDMGKILQSLFGYDHILLSEPVDETYLQSLREDIFWPFVMSTFLSPDPSTSDQLLLRRDILSITASLLFSLLPLHSSFVANKCCHLLTSSVCKQISEVLKSLEEQ